MNFKKRNEKIETQKRSILPKKAQLKDVSGSQGFVPTNCYVHYVTRETDPKP
jgi:hypothetical protein